MNEAPFSGGWDEEDLKKLKIQQTHTQKKKVLDTLSHTQTDTHTAGCVVGAERGGWRRKKLAGRQTLSDYFMCGFVVLLGHTLWVCPH